MVYNIVTKSKGVNFMNKTVKMILEIIKLVASALLGYYGGNAIM